MPAVEECQDNDLAGFPVRGSCCTQHGKVSYLTRNLQMQNPAWLTSHKECQWSNSERYKLLSLGHPVPSGTIRYLPTCCRDMGTAK